MLQFEVAPPGESLSIILIIQHHKVGRRFAHRKDKSCVCGTRGQGQQSILVMRRFLVKD